RFDLHAAMGLALAYLGRHEDAIREGQHAVEVASTNLSFRVGARYELARIYAIAGQPEKALDTLETSFREKGYLSPAWIAIDPNFASRRGNPRFQKLVAGKAAA